MLVSGVAAAAAATLFFVAGSAGRAPAYRTMSWFEHDTSQTNLDLGDQGAGPGDKFIFAGDNFNRKGGTKVGRTGGECTSVSASESLCSVSYTLPRGQISSQGLFNNAVLFGGKTVSFPITGGTGAYRDARGWGTVRVDTTSPNLTDAYFTLHWR
jgi:hypothetical protein